MCINIFIFSFVIIRLINCVSINCLYINLFIYNKQKYVYIYCNSIIGTPGPWPVLENIIWPTCEQRLPMHGLNVKEI